MASSVEYRDGTLWGQWRYNAERQVLVDTKGFYGVDLDECRDGGEAMDWVLQVAGKHWSTSVYIGDLVRALEGILMNHQVTHTVSCDFQNCGISETFTHLETSTCFADNDHWPIDWVFVERGRYDKQKYCPRHPVTVGNQGTITILDKPDIEVGDFNRAEYLKGEGTPVF